VGDGKGSYVLYQGGVIYNTAAYGAIDMTEYVRGQFAIYGGPRGPLGYVNTGRVNGLRDGGWMQFFEHGCITKSTSTTTQCVLGVRWDLWRQTGREGGSLGYPSGPWTYSTQSGWFQLFQKGAIAACATTSATVVAGDSYVKWSSLSRERGPLGYPKAAQEAGAGGGWIQLFQYGAICGGPVPTEAVPPPMYAPWVDAGREGGVLGYPTGPSHAVPRGLAQFFQKGELWGLTGGTPRRVYGAVLTAWKNAGGATGSYGFPVTDTTDTNDGRLTCTFEGGTITA
jgi:uncharacterized protein with LGFP repeats